MSVKVAGLVLAAGSGSRLGSPKAVVEIDGERLVDRTVRTLRSGGADPIVVVLGAALVDVPEVTVVTNSDWASGMGSSLRVGLAALPGGSDAVVVSLVDQPSIPAAVVARLIEAHAGGAAVAVATYGGKRRNPVLLARETWPEVAELAVGDAGARPYLAAHADQVVPVPCDDLGVPDDIDTPADLARYRAEIPSSSTD
jgi:CTP:molybdopterin cytidylyltransferase MocA